MGKFTLGVAIIYVLYYTGNIIYDLYIKKEKVVDTDETTEYAMGDFSNQVEEHIQNTTIDDVEEMNIPSGLEDNNYQEDNFDKEPTEQEQQENLSKLQRKYEEEEGQSEDAINEDETKTAVAEEHNSEPNEEIAVAEETPAEEQEENNGGIKISNPLLDNWDNLLNQAETSVKLTSNNNGHKTYTIT